MNSPVHKSLLDITTLFKIIPWLLIKHDADQKQLLKNAHDECKIVFERCDDLEARKLQLRSMIYNWMPLFGGIHPDFVENVVQLVIEGTESFFEKDSLKKEEK